jgi:hypothetical protein
MVHLESMALLTPEVLYFPEESLAKTAKERHDMTVRRLMESEMISWRTLRLGEITLEHVLSGGKR